MNTVGLIYLIKNKINGKCYIGQTIRELKYRINEHLSESRTLRHNYIIHKAIKKYTWDNFTVEVLESDIPLENLNKREIYFTLKYDALIPNGYVMRAGEGKETIMSDETKQKISLSKMGDKNPAKRKEVKEKISKANIGRRMSVETKVKISTKQLGKTHSEKTKLKMSKIKKQNQFGKNNPYAKSILCFDKMNTFIKQYDCIMDAANELNLHQSNISCVLNNKYKTTGNFKFKYK